nr:2-dehydropantoate 2-reductase [Sansalvadorimonas sp. 2012CJ34-2]
MGAGSIGCLWTSKLLQSGFACTVLLRPEKLDALGSFSHDLILTENGNTTTHTVSLEAAGTSGQIDNLIVTTKAFNALKAVRSVAGQLSPSATIVLLQNGMGSQQAIAETFPEHSVYAGSTTDGAWLEDFLKIQRAGSGKTWLGSISTEPSSSISMLAGLQDMDIELTTDIQSKLLAKLAINSAINGLAALQNCRNGDLLLSDNFRTVTQLCKETEEILLASGFRDNTNLLDVVKQVLISTGDNICSTLQDVRHQRPTELAWINGYLLGLAETLNIEAPGHHRLMNDLARQGIQ